MAVISKTLSDAIEGKKIGSIRSVFYTIAHEDPSFSTTKFFDTLDYVIKCDIPGLFEEYDGVEFKTENWDEVYWSDVASDLLDNFCMERINHLKEVGQKVYQRTTTSNSSQNHVQKKTNLEQSKKPSEIQISKKNEIGLYIAVGIVIVIILVIILILVK